MSDKSSQILGSYISKYNRIYNRKKTAKLSEQYDIKNVVNRLEAYREYKQTIRKERKAKSQIARRKIITKVKKAINKKLYSNTNTEFKEKFKPVYNPYMGMYKKLSANVDPKLIAKYKTGNVYSLHEFRHLTLPRSNHNITAGQAWHGLKNAWIGYKISTGNKDNLPDEENMKIYASVIQKWNYLLETSIMPSFPSIGISAEGFKYADILKKYFNGYEKEVVD